MADEPDEKPESAAVTSDADTATSSEPEAPEPKAPSGSEASSDGPSDAPKKKKLPLLFIIAPVALLVLGGGGAGAYFFLFAPKPAAAEEGHGEEKGGDHGAEKKGGDHGEKKDVALYQAGDELVVQVGNQKRNLILPRALVGLQPYGARFQDGALRIRFAPLEPAPQVVSGDQ